MEYYAHIVPETGNKQTLLEHLQNTAAMAARFAAEFDGEDIGALCGLLHDIGKYSDQFQRRLKGLTERVDHSTAGALEASKLGNAAAAFCIAGHHGGLPDGGTKKSATPEDATFCGKIKRVPGRDIADYGAFRDEVKPPKARTLPSFVADGKDAFFFTRMLFSCLVDADFLDTESFMSEKAVCRGGYDVIHTLLNRLNAYIAPWQNPETALNRIRCEILNSCIDASEAEQGLFTLTVPTGGGKTVASMAVALNHAKKWGLERVIYVIPYTSILEQTQAVFSKIFGADNVVAHYANVEYKTEDSGSDTDRRRLAAENWDAPIILTTSVQFFESLYANRPSSCRKLHNIAGSVLLFDEAQMLPVPYLRPCVFAISQLASKYRCSAILCTATQPSLNSLFQEFLPGAGIRELCPPVLAEDKIFRRVLFQTDGVLDDLQLAQKLNDENQVLCIVNSRAQAQDLYSMLDNEGSYHLSTSMYPAHRKRILAEIRQVLKTGQPCRVVSTSLIEAGVDVDFPVVYRAIAGLDAMIQAGGRCNREGKRPAESSVVHLFESRRKTPDIILQNVAAAEHTMRRFEDILSPMAIQSYFEFLYYRLKDPAALDAKGILREIEERFMPFASVAARVRIIETGDFTVYIPKGEGATLVSQLKTSGMSRGLMRKLGQYAVGVFPKHFKNLLDSGAAEQITENTAVLRDLTLYHETIGLALAVGEGREWIV